VSRGATEDLVAQLVDYEHSDLSERTKAALRLADRLTGDSPMVDETFHEALSRHFSDAEILDLGMTITFASGWQRFIEAFGIVPDRWRDGAPPPFHPLGGPDMAPQTPQRSGRPGGAVPPL
jgi:alkylhydroperoxidase family enzyme